MIYTLFIIVNVLMFITIIFFDRDMTAPAFLLVASFWCAVLCACLYADAWKFSNYKIVTMVTTGLCSFVLCSWISYKLFKQGKKVTVKISVPLEVTNLKLVIYIIFQIILYGLSFWVILKNTGIGINLAARIGTYYEMNRTGNIKYTSSLVSIGTILNFSGIYYMMYLAINNIFAKKKNKLLLYINIFIGVFGSLLSGTKTAFYMFVVSAFVMSVVHISKQNGWKRNINIRSTLKVCLIVVVLLISFSAINSVQGRTLEDVKIVDTLATYLGSPLKNLELFVNEKRTSNEIFGGQTFLNIYSDLYELTNNSIYKMESLYQYRWVNGYGLGNVYTIFMPLYYDFGIIGISIVMGIMGIFSQHIYNKLKYRKKNSEVDFYEIFYSYLAFAVMFSFFSNKFFECIISKAGVYFLIGLWLFDMFFCKLNIREFKIKIKK